MSKNQTTYNLDLKGYMRRNEENEFLELEAADTLWDTRHSFTPRPAYWIRNYELIVHNFPSA